MPHPNHQQHLRPTPPPLLFPRQSGFSCSLCTTTALSLANCTADTDPLCSCATTSYGALLSSCMASQKALGCSPSDWADATSSISADCSYWTESLGDALCSSCTSDVVASAGCTDYEDYACLCSATGYVAGFSGCVAGTGSFAASCPFASSTSVISSYSASCSSYASSTSAYPAGCPACQADAADQVSCSGRFDYSCLCSRSSYLPVLSSCVAAGENCYHSDLVIARSTYSSACAVVATGGTPATAAAVGLTGAAQTGARASPAVERPGVRIGAIAAVAGGAAFLLAVLVVGGCLLLRRRSRLPTQPDSVPLQPTGNALPPPPLALDYKGPAEADGIAVPGHPGYTPAPPPPGRVEVAAGNEWYPQGYMVPPNENNTSKLAGKPYVELGGVDGFVTPPLPIQQQRHRQQYQRPVPGGGGSMYELAGR
jgi:hypothetical protein